MGKGLIDFPRTQCLISHVNIMNHIGLLLYRMISECIIGTKLCVCVCIIRHENSVFVITVTICWLDDVLVILSGVLICRNSFKVLFSFLSNWYITTRTRLTQQLLLWWCLMLIKRLSMYWNWIYNICLFHSLFIHSIFCGSFHTTFPVYKAMKHKKLYLWHIYYTCACLLEFLLQLQQQSWRCSLLLCCNSNNIDCPNSKAFVATFSFVKRGRHIY